MAKLPIASIHVTPDLPEQEALALSDRVEADPDLIGMHTSVIDLRPGEVG